MSTCVFFFFFFFFSVFWSQPPVAVPTFTPCDASNSDAKKIITIILSVFQYILIKKELRFNVESILGCSMEPHYYKAQDQGLCFTLRLGHCRIICFLSALSREELVPVSPSFYLCKNCRPKLLSRKVNL